MPGQPKIAALYLGVLDASGETSETIFLPAPGDHLDVTFRNDIEWSEPDYGFLLSTAHRHIAAQKMTVEVLGVLHTQVRSHDTTRPVPAPDVPAVDATR